MTFLNVILLGGIAAVSIPLIVHFFNRSQPRVVRWGAMHLLEAAFQANSRRLNLEQLLLLLLRCLIPLALALCMARPVLTSMSQLMGSAKSSLVIVLDDSYSMAATTAGRTAFDEAKELASALVDEAGRGSDVAILLPGGTVRSLLEQPTFDNVRVNRELAQLRPMFGRANIVPAAEAGLKLLTEMTQPVRDLVIVSDFQSLNFANVPGSDWERFRKSVNDMPVQARVTMMPVGAPVNDNVSVASLDYSTLVHGVGQKFNLRANVQNHGDKEWPALRVYFRVDGEERSVTQIQLGPREQRQVLFSHTFEGAGSHLLEVFADADALKIDNSHRASLTVWDKLPVLLVNGEPSSLPLRGETDFLELALQPFRDSANGMANLMTTKVIALHELDANLLENYRVVVLGNVAQLADAQAKAVQQFVSRGGGLMVFPGNRANTEWYNRVMATTEGLLPLRMVQLEGETAGNSSGVKVTAQHFLHPALEFFNDPRNGKLSETEARIWYKTSFVPQARGGEAQLLAQFDGGSPFLAEKRFGMGRVIQCTIPCDADWSNLPMRPYFVPLMQRLVTYLASQVYPPQNLEPGQTIARFYSKSVAGRRLELMAPGGQRHEVIVEEKSGQGVLEFTATHDPGVYTLTQPDGTKVHFVVQNSGAESDLGLLAEEDAKKIAEKMDAKFVQSIEEFRELDRDRRFGREIWKPLLWVVLIALFGELFYQQWISRRKAAALPK